MAWSFSDEIHALAGYDADSTSTAASGETFVVHTNQWLTEGAREVINNLPANLQKLCTAMQSFTSAAAGSEAETLNTGKVFNVFAGSVNCRTIANTDKYRASDSGDVLYATSTDPAYYIESNFINVLPASLSCKYEEVQYPTVANTDTAIAVFPDEAEHLVVLYASMKALQYRMQIKSSDLPSDSDLNAVPPDVPSLASVTFTSVDSTLDAALPTYATATVVAGGVYGANTAPAYTKPGHPAQVSFNNFFESGSLNPLDDSDPLAFSVTAVPPDNVSDTIANFSADADVDDALANAKALINGNSPSATTDAFGALSNEDIELTSSAIQVASQEIGRANTELQKSLTTFNTDLQKFQASGLNKFSAEVAEYQAEVNAQVQEYSQKLSRYQLELNTVYQAWAKTESDNLQVFQSDIQNELNEFNKKNVSFQANIQEAMQEIQVANQVNIAKAQGELQKNISNEDRDQQRQLQNGINDMQAIVQNNQSLISKYTAESQAYTAEVNAQVQEFTTKIQKHTADYQWLQGQYASLKADYMAGLTALKGGAVAGGGA